MSGLPSGAVTFVFTDIEGSTRLVKALRDRYPRVLAEHRRLVRAAIAAQAGHEVDTQGDAFFVAFAGAKQAVLCALEIQRALAGHEWPPGAPVRVRIGIHTGNAAPAEGMYTGLAVHRAARICAAARGGQVLVSQATQTIIEDEEEDPGFTLSDLGERTLKDLDRPVRLFQLAAAGLDTRAPPAAQRAAGPARAPAAAPIGAEPGAFAAAATRALPRDTASFTGRQAELAWLLGEVGSLVATGGVVGIHAIDGMAGIGKTTLAVHAAHQLAERFPDGQFFLPLHGHTPGQRPVDPADALASLLLTAGFTPQLIPPGLEARAARWRDQVAGKKILLVLDDAASHEQVAPLLPGTAGSLVLITSRRRLAAVQDATVVSLDTLPPPEAGVLLARLAGRPEMRPGDVAVSEITRLCGYLPLAIGMLAAQLRHHPAWTPAGLAASLDEARDRLALMHAENLSVAAAFDLSYQDLTPSQQRLFRRLGLVPGPGIDAYAAAALDGTSLEQARRRLDELYDQHLLTETAPDRYQQHDLLREHAHTLATADDAADVARATERLLDYYLHTAAAANRLTAQRPSSAIPPVAYPPAAAPPLASTKDAETWLQAERANVQACADHAASHGLAVHAVWLPAQLGDFLRTHGYLDQALALHQAAAEIAQGAGDRAGQATALRSLGYICRLLGQYSAALESLTRALGLYRDLGDQPGQVDVLDLLARIQLNIDDFAAANASATEALAIARAAGDKFGEGNVLATFADVQRNEADGGLQAAAASYSQALALLREVGDQHGQARALTMAGPIQAWMGDYDLAISSLTESVALCRDLGDPLYEGLALIRLGRVYCVTSDYPAATMALTRGLALVRALGSRGWEAEALTELGALQHLTGDYEAAAVSLNQAIVMFREVGARAEEAQALTYLGALEATTLGPEDGLARCTEALTIVRDTGALLEQADVLAGIGRCHLQAGDTADGIAFLRQALDIYQRIGAASAQSVREILKEHPT
jgi:class 3 adenylate cyclase/tetratricopeptide (TPR) repeat protein